MKLHSALSIALCFLGTMHLAHAGILQKLGLEEAIRSEIGAIVEETFRGGENFGLSFYNADEDAAAGRPIEMISLINYFLKKAVPDKSVRQALIMELGTVDAGEQSAEGVTAEMADNGINGLRPDAPAHIKQIIAIIEKHLPNQDLRNKLYASLTQIKLGDIKAKEVGSVVYMLDSKSK